MQVFVPAHMLSDHDHPAHASSLLGMLGQRWSSRSIIGGDAGLMTTSKRSGCESGWCSVADVFEVYSKPRQSMIWRRSVQRLRKRYRRREGGMSFRVFRRSCTPSVPRHRDSESGSSSESAWRVWSWVVRCLIEQVSTEPCSGIAEQGARANAGICHAACDRRSFEMKPQKAGRNAARGAPAPGVAHL